MTQSTQLRIIVLGGPPKKAYIKSLFLLPALFAVLNLLPARRVTAQTFNILHRFNGSDGGAPWDNLILSGNTLYGTASGGGISGNGTVFAVNTEGTGFTTLHSFTAISNNSSGAYTNSDGADPEAGLVSWGGILYGTTYGGGRSSFGTVFAVRTNGTGFTTLHAFAGYPIDGANPLAGLVLSGNILYGTTQGGGTSGAGTLFAVHTDGTGLTNLHSFATGASNTNGYYTNSDGFSPVVGLVLSGNTRYGVVQGGGTLYGTTRGGGTSGAGTVFAVNINGTGFTNLHTFSAGSGPVGDEGTNSDGAGPAARLILSGKTLYGMAAHGGSSGNGTVFAVNTNGTGFTNLHSFSASPVSAGIYGTNSDGITPVAGLVSSGNTLYGTAVGGGSSGFGTVFAVGTDGTGFTTLHDFALHDGIAPIAGLVLSGNTLYGTTSDYWFGYGTVFSLSLAPPPLHLAITPSEAHVILTWPTNVAGFDCTGFTLQSTTNLASPAVWSTVSPAPVVVNGQNTVTNPITGPQKFYRLNQ